jgi:hypothetical protein
MPHSRKASNSALTKSGRPALVFHLGKKRLQMFLDHLIEDGVFRTPSLIVDARVWRAGNGCPVDTRSGRCALYPRYPYSVCSNSSLIAKTGRLGTKMDSSTDRRVVLNPCRWSVENRWKTIKLRIPRRVQWNGRFHALEWPELGIRDRLVMAVMQEC